MKKKVVRGRDTLRLGAPMKSPALVALAIGDVIEDLTLAERTLFRICAEEHRREQVQFTQHELDVIFAAWHAIKGCVGMLRARDPWKEKKQ